MALREEELEVSLAPGTAPLEEWKSPGAPPPSSHVSSNDPSSLPSSSPQPPQHHQFTTPPPASTTNTFTPPLPPSSSSGSFPPPPHPPISNPGGAPNGPFTPPLAPMPPPPHADRMGCPGGGPYSHPPHPHHHGPPPPGFNGHMMAPHFHGVPPPGHPPFGPGPPHMMHGPHMDRLEHGLQRSHQNLGFDVHLGWSFYLHLLAVFLVSLVCVGLGLQINWASHLGGDPTKHQRDVTGTESKTIANPWVSESENNGSKHHHHHQRRTPPSPSRGRVRRVPSGGHSRGYVAKVGSSNRGPDRRRSYPRTVDVVALTSLPHQITVINGGTSVVDNGSLSAATSPGMVALLRGTPKRSSLKKKRPDSQSGEGAIIENPNFDDPNRPSGKRVRIQTDATDV
ncbi:unnamed protein product [Cyprideis torosa]|uniref:Uncharacterized protein n=1 Tax=Cyprideis torosa TaxID=163714 RepID=A0A7R8WFN8_9CRUS|nr:unnamed protein product [Cyprideis torosa]CAG0890803.1 unnamed protein product [Cyprideis torosa]